MSLIIIFFLAIFIYNVKKEILHYKCLSKYAKSRTFKNDDKCFASDKVSTFKTHSSSNLAVGLASGLATGTMLAGSFKEVYDDSNETSDFLINSVNRTDFSTDYSNHTIDFSSDAITDTLLGNNIQGFLEDLHGMSDFQINPANGLPMIGGIGGIDIMGNTFGIDSSQSICDLSTDFSSFSSSTSFCDDSCFSDSSFGSSGSDWD